MQTKLEAHSTERYRATAAERRQYGGSTVTVFYVFRPEDRHEPQNWAKVNGYGKLPGNRETDAIARGRAELVKRGIIPE